MKDEAKGLEAEARVGGGLRGGILRGKTFIFHAGSTKVETKEFTDLKVIQNHSLDIGPFGIPWAE